MTLGNYPGSMPRKLLVIDLVGLTPHVLEHMPQLSKFFGDGVRLAPPLPAVTCTSQATITTGTLPREHGIVSNGWYFRESAEVRFWLRSDRLVAGEKIWDTAKQRDPSIRVANLFWRFCTHSGCDITLTERPTYWATGKKSPDVYTTPSQLRNELVGQFGEFPLFRFWGPATNIASTDWIANATLHVIHTADPHLTLTYLPHLDYDLQKFGPRSDQAMSALQEVDDTIGRLIDGAQVAGRDVAVLSEYGITPVSRPVYLNRVLRQAGFLSVYKAQNGEVLEPGACRAFAACSHQVAHVYVSDEADRQPVRELLESTEGVERVLGASEKQSAGLDHPRAGEYVVVADSDSWFAYPYWLDDSLAPDFARCVAIHDKPGHDPVEMFLGAGGKRRLIRRLAQSRLGFRVPFDVISLDAGLIHGSHGRMPDDPLDGPLLLTSWSHAAAGTLPMQNVKSLLLDQLLP